MGRLFDAVAALIGVREQINYEAQAAIELESLIDPEESGCYPFEFENGLIYPVLLLKSIISDLRSHLPLSIISTRFHNSTIQIIVTVCRQVRADFGCKNIALSGGVWQNKYLLQKTEQQLRKDRFNVMLHSQVPTNDGGISLGQAMVAARSLQIFKQG